MKRVAIQDANILIDLVKTGLFDFCLALEYQFTTTDIILEELRDDQVALIQPHIHAEKFTVISISDQELVEIALMSQEDAKVSEQDWSGLYFALQKGAILVSGDGRMRKIAKEKSIEYHGIFWLMDQLVDTSVLSGAQASEFMQKLISVNKRLPSNECSERIKKWSR